jgi:F-type H+-transporting ATPase subunit b
MILLALAESIQLVPDGTLFLHIAIILAMIFLLNRILFRPVNRVLAERESHTRGRSSEARGTVKRVEESLLRYERSLREARAESYQLLERQQAEAAGERRRRLDGVREEVGGLIEEQKRVIREQAEEARGNLESEARRAAANISAQILGRPV